MSSFFRRLRSMAPQYRPRRAMPGGEQRPGQFPSRAQSLKEIAFTGYGAPAGLLAVFILFAVYAFSTRDRGAAPGLFPRTSSGFLEARKLDRRLAGLAERIAADPDDIQALFESGLLKFQKGPAGYVDAISDLENARSKGLSDIRTFYYLGRMYQAEGLYEFALEEYRRFLNNRPEDLEVRMLAAKLLYTAGKYAQAVSEYEAITEDYPDDLTALENLALSRWKNGQDPAPVAGALRGLGPEGGFRADHIAGRVAYERKDFAAAAPALERAAAESAKYPGFADRAEIYRMLADSFVKLKSGNKAIAALNELLVINPSNDEARSLLARLAKAQKSGTSKTKSGKSAK